jgi:predicted RNase H-like HicB family nuclease
MSKPDHLLAQILAGSSDAKLRGNSLIKYELIIYWSAEDGSFIAEVPELPGCMADGQTYQQTIENVEVVIQEWIETARELGRPIPEPKGRLLYA